MWQFLKFAILLSVILACECSTPAIQPFQPFLAQNDATILCDAVKNNETIDDISVIQILTSRSFQQRQEIMKGFEKVCSGNKFLTLFENHHKDDDLFLKVIKTLLTPLAEFYADEIYNEATSQNVSSNAILDILTTVTDKEIQDIQNAHKRLRPNSNSLAKIVENPYRIKDFLLGFPVEFFSFTREGYQKSTGNVFNATKLARWFYWVGDGKNALDRPRGDERQTSKTFRRCTYNEILAILDRYEEMYHKDFVSTIKNRGFAQDVERGILTMIRVVRSTPLYFADRLYESLRGSIGPDNKAIIRIIVGRSEIDLADISKEFENKYGRSLVSVIGSKNEDSAYLNTLQSIVNGGKR